MLLCIWRTTNNWWQAAVNPQTLSLSSLSLSDNKSLCLCRYFYPFLWFIESFRSVRQQLSEGRGHTSATRPTVSTSQLLGLGVWGQMASPCTPSNSHPALHIVTASWYSCVINHSMTDPCFCLITCTFSALWNRSRWSKEFTQAHWSYLTYVYHYYYKCLVSDMILYSFHVREFWGFSFLLSSNCHSSVSYHSFLNW